MGCNHDTIHLGEATRAALVRELQKSANRPPVTPSLLTTMPDYGYAPPSLTEADVRRIVAEELDARRPGPLDVSAEDIRRYLPRGLP
jgi:hypothetical protein